MVDIFIQKEVPINVRRPRRHEERALDMTRDDIIHQLTIMNVMHKSINKDAQDLVESPEKLKERTVEELRELYIEITGKISF